MLKTANFRVVSKHHIQPPAFRHGLGSVLNHVDDRLLQQIGVHVHYHGIRRQLVL